MSDSVARSQGELAEVQNRNPDALQKHEEAMAAALGVEERKVVDLQRQIDDAFEKQGMVEPELHRMWEEKRQTLVAGFRTADDVFEAGHRAKTATARDARTKLECTQLQLAQAQELQTAALSLLQTEMDETLGQLAAENGRRLVETITAHRQSFEKYVEELAATLRALRAKAANEQESLKARALKNTSGR
jgi:hypothetical protein